MSDAILASVAALAAKIDGARADVMGRLNVQTGRILDSLTSLEADVRNARSEHSVTRELVTALPATVLGAIEKSLLRRMTDLETRITKLEGEEDGNQ